LSSGADEAQIEKSVIAMVEKVKTYVPGYRLKQKVQFERFGSNNPIAIPGVGTFEGVKTSVFLEVEGAAHYLPAYAGNLDIMTSAALATGEKMAMRKREERAA
jgi:acetaldehyde dehydrogenase